MGSENPHDRAAEVSDDRGRTRIDAWVGDLAAEYSACSVARAHVRDFGRRHGVYVEDAELCASEILANAIRADEQTPGRIGLVRLAVAAFHPEVLLVAVRDWGRGVPTLRKPAADDLGGRGLAVVDGLSVAWGVVDGRNGKTVWCRLPLESAATAAAVPTRRAVVIPSRFSTELAVAERVLRRMRRLWPDPVPSPSFR
jgi:anti-sigma regulatory factor (Ser/Thr protein kinase)